MTIIDWMLVVICLSICTVSAFTDIRIKKIKNVIIFPATGIAFILNLVNSIFIGKWTVFLVNFIFITLFGVVLYGLHFMGAGDSKLLAFISAVIPVCFYENALSGWFGEILVLVNIFIVCMIYVIGESFYMMAVLKNRGSPSQKFNISKFLLGYLKGIVVITAINQLLWFSCNTLYVENQYVVMILNCLISSKLSEIKVVSRWYVSVPIFVLEVFIAFATSYCQRLINSDYRMFIAFIVYLIIRKLFVDRYNYKTIPTSEVKAGMVLSMQTTLLMAKSRVKGLPNISTEDFRSKITLSEAESVHRWEKSKYGASEVLIVRYLPFGLFIALGAILFVIEGIVKYYAFEYV